ncbi:leucine-rich repeat-containing protein 24-like [Argiope bruennichi]|nr:leucine-rich repeat-containing protein 24-like [Argiope bruennichi]XP_055927844.1 leucine-rich repeat-containing protein 24-like [Argiope bruennichi]XP_055927845.1 leucine-rich repeat-containing protein 24-like [Argiope bruennichi]XP_055927846.1 leucine-rich repeat-containing protein 24-like [Argiope bruennichi]
MNFLRIKIGESKRESKFLIPSNEYIWFIMGRILFLVILLSVLTQLSFCMSCHPKCQCIWRKGKQTAECSSAGFEKIPLGLETTIQVLDLTRNNFTLLPPNSFLNVGLVNLQKLYLSRCGIEHVDDFALNRISNLVELDLSDNLISYIPTAAFRHLPLLRHLILNGNPLVIVPTQAFVELKTLIILEISNCKIDTIATRAFEGLEKLEVLKLDSNELQTLHAKTMTPFKFLHGITLDGNPWTCDCELRGLREWLNNNNVPYIPPNCYRPARLRDKIWTEVGIDDYACAPIFLNTSSAMNVFEGSNVTLECKVSGDPIPSIQWLWRERVIANLSEGISSMQTFIMSEYAEKEKISRLKISSVQEPNAGVYTCVASNTAGKVAKNFTLMVSRIPVTGPKIIEEEKTQEVKEEEEEKGNSIAGMAIGMVGGIVIVVVILSAVLWICRRKRKRNNQRKRIEANHKMCNSVNPTAPKVPQEDSDLKILGVNPMGKTSRLGGYENLPTNELDHYENVMLDSSMAPPVWMVQDHLPPSDMEWDGHNPPQAMMIPQQVLVEKRTPASVTMAGPPEDIHVRFQHELSDTLRRKTGDRKMVSDRERGDGSSELETIDPDSIKIHFESPAIREEEKNSRVSSFLPDKCSDEKGPDLIDHARAVAGEIDEWKNASAQPWMYDQGATYYRPAVAQAKNITAASRMSSDGESTATEV